MVNVEHPALGVAGEAFADFCGVNTPTMSEFKLPADLSECRRGKRVHMSPREPGQASSSVQ